MDIVSAHSNRESVPAAVTDLKQQFRNLAVKLVIFYASSIYAPESVSREMQQAFPEATVFGCSTAGEIACGKMLKNSITAMAFNAHALTGVDVAVVENVHDENCIERAFTLLEKRCGATMRDLDPGRYAGMVLIDGLCGVEERLIDRICDLTDITFVGGSAGDDLKFAATHVYANGKSYRNAAVLALLKPAADFSFIKTQSFRVLPKTLVVTKADEAKREVIDFNNQPAAKAYAEALGVTVQEAAGRFMQNPLGLVIGDEPFVRSPQQIKDGSMFFYCSLMEGMELSVLESTDIIEDTDKALKEVKARLGSISGVINFNCILRTQELEKKQSTESYGDLFAYVPTTGFSTYGEQYFGHMNQTATMLVFK